MIPTVLIPLAHGFEEMEGVILADVWRRAGWKVDLVSLTPGPVIASRGVRLLPDAEWSAIHPDRYDILALPGGMGGTEALCADTRILDAVRMFDRHPDKWLIAICAAPLVLQAAGILNPERQVTCHPAVADRLISAKRRSERTVRDGHLITSQGPGTAFELALTLVALLGGQQEADRLAAGLLVPSPKVEI